MRLLSRSFPRQTKLQSVPQTRHISSADLQAQALECVRISVDWPLGDDSWKDVGTGKLHNLISEYSLHDNGWSVWSYRLDLKFPMYVSEFRFYDESGDCYDLWVTPATPKEEHFIRYNSAKPKIIGVGYAGTCSACKGRRVVFEN
jgi:hypothetical protein